MFFKGVEIKYRHCEQNEKMIKYRTLTYIVSTGL